MSNCYKFCNDKYDTFNPKRIFCKKGCDGDSDTQYIYSFKYIVNFAKMKFVKNSASKQKSVMKGNNQAVKKLNI